MEGGSELKRMFSLFESVCSAGAGAGGDVPAARGGPGVPGDNAFSFLLVGRLGPWLCWDASRGGGGAESGARWRRAARKVCAGAVGRSGAADIAGTSPGCNSSVSRCFRGTVLLFWKSSHSLLVI